MSGRGGGILREGGNNVTIEERDWEIEAFWDAFLKYGPFIMWCVFRKEERP